MKGFTKKSLRNQGFIKKSLRNQGGENPGENLFFLFQKNYTFQKQNLVSARVKVTLRSMILANYFFRIKVKKCDLNN